MDVEEATSIIRKDYPEVTVREVAGICYSIGESLEDVNHQRVMWILEERERAAREVQERKAEIEGPSWRAAMGVPAPYQAPSGESSWRSAMGLAQLRGGAEE
jgi:hypothetical protein